MSRKTIRKIKDASRDGVFLFDYPGFVDIACLILNALFLIQYLFLNCWQPIKKNNYGKSGEIK